MCGAKNGGESYRSDFSDLSDLSDSPRTRSFREFRKKRGDRAFFSGLRHVYYARDTVKT